MARPGDQPPTHRVDPALVLNDPDLVASRLTSLSLTGPKVMVDTSLALGVARKYYPDVSTSELDAAVEASGGDRLQHLNLDIWPAVKRWLNSEPKGQNHMYWVPLNAIVSDAIASPAKPSDLSRGLAAGTGIGVLAFVIGLSVPLAVAAGGLWAGAITYRGWRNRHTKAARAATYDARLTLHRLGPGRSSGTT